MQYQMIAYKKVYYQYCFPLAVVGCGELSDPSNGQVEVTAFTFGSVATYSCSAGCQPVGPSTRLCEADGTWSGLPPLCPGSYSLSNQRPFHSLRQNIIVVTCSYKAN